jgi:large subunit ribosomal protein L15
VKILGNGELKKKLTVRVHAISATAREKVEAAGGTVSLLREPKLKKPKRAKPAPAAQAQEPEPTEEAPAAEEAAPAAEEE